MYVYIYNTLLIKHCSQRYSLISTAAKVFEVTIVSHSRVFFIILLRYFICEQSFKLRWYRARDLFGSQIPLTAGGLVG